MIDRKSLTWFLGIAFSVSWILFLTPLTLASLDMQTRQLATVGLWSIAMWGPGLAAILATTLISKQPFHALRLNTLGPKRFYVWAWFLPVVIVIIAGILTVLFGVAQFDNDLTLIRESMAGVPGAEKINPIIVILVQSAFAILVAPFINVLFALGEEIGWRGFLLPKLLPLGQWRAIMSSGVIWGIWHVPTIIQGQNYPGHPVLGLFMMLIFCVLLGTILAWLYLNTRSPWAAALAHGSVNAVAGLPVLFMKSGFDLAFGGTIATPPAWLVMGVFIAWLAVTKRLPVQGPADEKATSRLEGKESNII
jgi:membrane protease YdiL (CAAX protease family)